MVWYEVRTKSGAARGEAECTGLIKMLCGVMFCYRTMKIALLIQFCSHDDLIAKRACVCCAFCC